MMQTVYPDEHVAGIAHFCLWMLQGYLPCGASAVAMRDMGINNMFFVPTIPQLLVNIAAKRLLSSGCASSDDNWILKITDKGKRYLEEAFQDEGRNMLALGIAMFGVKS